MSSATNVLIADDHALIRNGLKQVLKSQVGFQVTEAENGEDALKHIREQKPHIAILDIDMPAMTGFEVAMRVHKESINIDIVFLTMFKDELMFNKAMDIGVKGYMLKENTVAEIVQCIKFVLAGKYYLSPAISEYLIRRNSKLVSPAADKNGISHLTPAEKDILKLLAMMKTNQEIADEQNISIKTVQNHRYNICNKLDISGTHALLKFAVEHSHLV